MHCNEKNFGILKSLQGADREDLSSECVDCVSSYSMSVNATGGL